MSELTLRCQDGVIRTACVLGGGNQPAQWTKLVKWSVHSRTTFPSLKSDFLHRRESAVSSGNVNVRDATTPWTSRSQVP